jgi:hypothetical protein
MKLSEYRSSSSWKGAIELGPKLISLADDLPGSEGMGLSRQIRELMVEIPASMAMDMMHEHSDSRMVPVIKLLATLEIIDKVYPALDTAGIRADVDALAEKLSDGETFGHAEEPKPADHPAEPKPAPSATPVLASDVSVSPSGDVGETAQPAEPSPAPVTTSVPVVAEPSAAPSSTQEPNVQPDSGQQAQ